jgi:hypothetical protein
MTAGRDGCSLPRPTSSATSPIEIGVPEHTLYAGMEPAGCDTTASTARTFAAATSSTWTKSRICDPSSNTLGASPRARADRNIAATPEYGVSAGIPGP